MDIKEHNSGVRPENHWYYRTKRIPLAEYFDRTARIMSPVNVVDIGAGSGCFSDYLAGHGRGKIENIIRVDAAYESETSAGDSRISGQLITLRQMPADIRRSLIVLMDVLEHIDDDAGFLRDVVSRCRGGNRVFITVPAFMGLWSAHDVFLEHKRRYTLSQLEKTAEGAGIRLERGYYIYAGIFPLVWLMRRLRRGGKPVSDMKDNGKALSFILERLIRLEMPFRKYNRFCGLTCVVEGIIAG
ncbi:MAG: methyltransferase domain-containing protein [Elusimicrobiales bacterium]